VLYPLSYGGQIFYGPEDRLSDYEHF
jgi:hypothetical protein